MLTAILLAGYSCAHEFIPRWIPTTRTKCCLLSCKRGQTHWNRYRKNSNVHASTPTQKKNMHKIRLYIVFISIRASQKMLLVSTDLILCFCFHPIFSRWSFFFCFFFHFYFVVVVVWSECIWLIVLWTSEPRRKQAIRYATVASAGAR